MLLLPLYVAVAGSALLLVDYLRPAPVFCAEGGGCDAIKHTALATPLGVPTPALGVAAFVALTLLTLMSGARARLVEMVLASAAAVVGMVLLTTQALLGTYCVFCVTVDVASVLVAGGVAAHLLGAWERPAGVRAFGGIGLALALFVPIGIGAFKRPIAPLVPDVIAEALARVPKGKAGVVDFADFECPFCRMTHENLAPLVQERKNRVQVVRKLVPLTRIHPHALDAARAACCGEVLGKGDAMADALFAAPVDDLTPVGCERIAQALGLRLDLYRACLADPKTDARLTEDRAVFEKAAVKGDGLPLLWIGDRKMMGAQEEEALKGALDQAIARTGS